MSVPAPERRIGALPLSGPLPDLRLPLSFSELVGITLGGLFLSFAYDLPSGPAIILLGAVLLIGVYGVKKVPRRRLA